MATAGTGTQNRLSAILLNVGTPVARTLFENRVKDLTPPGHDPFPWTVDEFLLENKPKIRAMLRNKHSQILPDNLQSVKLENWDLAQLCRILLECCELQPDIKHFIQHLLKLRNKLFHMSEPTADDTKYNNYLCKLKAIICSCLKEINDEVFSEKINKMVADLEQGYFTGEVMEQLKSMHVETTETLSEFKQNQQLMFSKFQELLQKMNVIETRLDPSDKIQIPESGVEIHVKNCTIEKENEISNHLVQYFEECIMEEDEFQDMSTSCQQKIKEAVQRACKLFLSNGYKPVKAEKRCIFIRFQFTSLKSLISFFREYVSGELTVMLQDVQTAVRMETECEDVTLEVIMDTEDILATFNEIVEAVSGVLQSWNIAANKGTLYTEKYAEAKIRGVHLVQRMSEDSSEITNGVRYPFENYSAEHMQHLKGSFESGEMDTVMQNIQEAVADEFKTPSIRISAHLFEERKPPHADTAKRLRTSVGSNKNVEKRKSHDAHTPRKHCLRDVILVLSWLCLSIVLAILISHISRRADIMTWGYTKVLDKSPSTETQEVSVDKDQHTIATVEIYRAQRKIAYYFELTYLQLADHPEQAKAVRLMAHSARTQHLMTSGLMKKFAMTSAHIVDTMIPQLSDAVCELKSEAVVMDIFGQIIKIAEEMKTETESVFQR
ncbi:uncharacterized protein LOC128559426 [Mercenaria mercenaria]|uniref:uncharacterized protein LOC128559426 n=1 Tax=Mercenaria mercenaria TaxID=6596 RepID=UPI00234F8094|nr:uncharacterized protein LOC128559426 [Mercenaria mercenaria]